ncbi:prepilin-type N-terminal cleavage/methylation domain-containing protein [Candidatus Microgenomates bacterium]|nr:MAG: prepilin-type N-terminal cleavage/methylation domain-containing protein [Candidatus Microgenomates bacterium]
MIIKKGFTLIEVLIVIVIIGVLVSIAAFGLQGAREGARDAKRRSDLEAVSAALELYRSDCNQYPSPSSNRVPSPLIGNNSITTCSSSNSYMSSVPTDPQSVKYYRYARPSASRFEICASLERGSGTVTCGGSSNCGTGSTCNYKITSP